MRFVINIAINIKNIDNHQNHLLPGKASGRWAPPRAHPKKKKQGRDGRRRGARAPLLINATLLTPGHKSYLADFEVVFFQKKKKGLISLRSFCSFSSFFLFFLFVLSVLSLRSFCSFSSFFLFIGPFFRKKGLVFGNCPPR